LDAFIERRNLTSTGRKFCAIVIDNGEIIHEICVKDERTFQQITGGLRTRMTEKKPLFTVLETSSSDFAPPMMAIEERYAFRRNEKSNELAPAFEREETHLQLE
jgi:hypothetical protein